MILENLCGQSWPAHLKQSSINSFNRAAQSGNSSNKGTFVGRSVNHAETKRNAMPKRLSEMTYESASKGLVDGTNGLITAARSAKKIPNRKAKALAYTSEVTINLLMKLAVKPAVSDYLKASNKQ